MKTFLVLAILTATVLTGCTRENDTNDACWQQPLPGTIVVENPNNE